MIIETLVAAFVPVVAEGLKRGVGKIFGGAKPVTIDDQIKLDQSDIAKLEALAKLDSPGGTPSQWVIDLRASARYIAAGVVIVGGLSLSFITGLTPEIVKTGLEAANIAFGFLFGSRIVSSWQR
jgi:hypothetical protein